ncbi:putative GPI-anchored protein [Sesamum angolense]|uniref:GPI-anchored protein n=1 Tax=Sesamum angolense TaxID=2727404 RepID=A0AAE1WTF1_9LAMI|nr:putative GPI-anchored protein [Sesamum angolense]
MRGGVVPSLNLYALILLLHLLCIHESRCMTLGYPVSSHLADRRADELIPDISPTIAPEPFLPLLAPSPLTPFTNSTIPKLSGLCVLNFTALTNMMMVTSTDCMAAFAPLLANVVCCPQVEATLVILIGQSSKHTNTLALNGSLAAHCLSDFEQILVGQGANDSLSKICSVHSSNLTEGSCPVSDVAEFESTVDSANLLAACGKIDIVNECCEQLCQNAILDAATKLAQKAYNLMSLDGSHVLSDHSTRINDCKSIVLRWLGGKLEHLVQKKFFEDCLIAELIKVNCEYGSYMLLTPQGNNPMVQAHVSYGRFGVWTLVCEYMLVCPLKFPNMNHVIEGCGPGISNRTACCSSVENYVSHLQRQSFVTNLQALNCAASLGTKLRKANITQNVYSQCHISLKDFSLQESGCLLPSLPSDVVFDKSTGVSFLCDLNDNIPAPWPAASQLAASSCNRTVKIPALPAAASGQSSFESKDAKSLLWLMVSAALLILI